MCIRDSCYSVEFSDKPIDIRDLIKDLKNLSKGSSGSTAKNNIVRLKKMFSIN